MRVSLVKNPSATALKKIKNILTELTVIIIDKENKTAMHKTFVADLSRENTFTYCHNAPTEGLEVPEDEAKKYTYTIPKGEATHYNPGFFELNLKLALFFTRHKIWATLFDWFKLRDKAVLPVGFIYEKGKTAPIPHQRPEIDFAQENFNIRHNSIINKRFKAVKKKLDRNQESPVKWALVIGAIIIVLVVAFVLISFMTNNQNAAQQIANATATATPPAPIVIK